jgi:hypothetical protein
VVIFSYQKNVRLEGIDPFSGYLISVLGHIPGQALGISSVFSRSGSRLGMAFFALNPTFAPLKTPFGSSYGVVSRCFLSFVGCLALFVDCFGLFWIVTVLFRHCCGVDCGLTMD